MSARCWIGSSAACWRGRAGCWSFAARRASARRRCWSIWSAPRPGCRIARVGGCRVRDGAAVRRPARAVRADAGPPAARLPDPQRDALGTAFGLSAGPPPDRFLVGLAVLSLLADVAEEQPLVCIVDDAQWLDQVSAQTLAFVARRLLAERVGLVFALREPSDEQALAGLPELVVDGLEGPDAQALLDSTLPGPLDERVRDRILAEARRQPARAAGAAARADAARAVAGGFGLPGAAAAGQPHRAGLRAAARTAPGRDPAAAAARGGRARRRRDAAAARGRRCSGSAPTRRHRPRPRLDRHRRAGAVPASAGALGGLPRGERAGPPGRPSRAGRGDRSAARSRSARVASRAGGGAPRRVRRRRAGALRRPRAQTAAASPRRPPSSSERQS